MFVAALAGWVSLASALVLAPARVREVCEKEGACEIVSHVVLALAAVGFVAALARSRGRAAPWALALVAGGCVVVLGEELDWGGVLGVRTLAAPLERALGSANVHNAARGHSYLVFALAAPLVAAVALGRGAWSERWRARLGPWAPASADGLAVLLVAAVALATAVLAPSWDAVVDEVAELLAYAVVAAIAVRGHFTPARAGPTPARATPASAVSRR
jgi:hypothetical protein